jgi:hypothetical protein
VFVDSPGGGSPTYGCGLIGPEDPAGLVPLVLDIGFYSLIVWLAMWFMQLIPGKLFPVEGLLASLLLTILFAYSLCLYSWRFGVPIGRGQIIQVYVDTATDRGATSAFIPSVSIPVEELIENYGNPDYVWLTFESSTEPSSTRVMLHWTSIRMFAQLARVANKAYPIQKTTQVEMIIIPDSGPVIAFDGISLGEIKIPWSGYGNYPPQSQTYP